MRARDASVNRMNAVDGLVASVSTVAGGAVIGTTFSSGIGAIVGAIVGVAIAIMILGLSKGKEINHYHDIANSN